MSFSEMAKSIGASATLQLNAKAAALRAEGEPVIHLGGGEPKSLAPDTAIVATTELLQTGEIRYAPTSGIPALKQAIIRYTEKYYNRQVGPANVMAATGAKHAIMCCMQAVLDPGDEVIFPVPYWVSYPDMTRICLARPVPAAPADGSAYPRIGDIEKKISDRTKAIILNSPNNPSGVVYPEEFICDIVRYCEKHGIYLIMDDIYHRLVFDGRKVASPYDYAGDLDPDSRLIIINSVSKQYAMTGFRLGWSVANEKLTKVMTNLQSHQTSGASMLAMWGATAALDGDQSSVDDLRATLESNRNVMLQQLEPLPGVEVIKPEGTFYCLCDFRSYDEDSTRLSAFLLDKVLVLTVPGIEFGLEGHLRLSFCGSVQDITEGVARIRWALDPKAPRELQIGDRTLVRDWD